MGASIQFPFPAEQMAANLVTLHPRLMTVVAQLLGTDDIMLTRSNLSSKYGIDVARPEEKASVGDQGMHKVRADTSHACLRRAFAVSWLPLTRLVL